MSDYLDSPPQRYRHGSREMVEHEYGEWVKFVDMDLYMFEGAQMLNRISERLAEARALLARYGTESEWDADYAPAIDAFLCSSDIKEVRHE